MLTKTWSKTSYSRRNVRRWATRGLQKYLARTPFATPSAYTQSIVARLAKELYSGGVEERRSRRLTRRRYTSLGPNFYWHIDGKFIKLVAIYVQHSH